jgi:hypothetical protein
VEVPIVNLADMLSEAQTEYLEEVHRREAELSAQVRADFIKYGAIMCSCRRWPSQPWSGEGVPQWGCPVHADLGCLIQSLPWPYRESFGGTQ